MKYIIIDWSGDTNLFPYHHSQTIYTFEDAMDVVRTMFLSGLNVALLQGKDNKIIAVSTRLFTQR
jgi:hypothetical protein